MRRGDVAFAALAAVAATVLWLDPGAGVLDSCLTSGSVVVRALSLPTEVRRRVLESGETLSALLGRLGVSASEVPAWVQEAQRFLEPRALPVGLLAEGVLDVHGVLRAVRLSPDWQATVVLERSGDAIRGHREPRSVERELAVVRGTVRSSLFEAVDATGEDETLAVKLADLFQWDIDFHREVRAGDTFALVVERVRSGGRTVAYGPVLAAEYVNAGRRYIAVRYAAAGTSAGYYDASGRPLRKQFLRAPLRFTRVTSRYTASRLHPILGVRLPHWGVDYGAPVGTPVMATADGIVISAGRRGGGGNEVQIRHAGGYVTGYLHLSRFAGGVRPGSRVSQGQIIGYVGSTGLSTGPHLDYRVTRNGAHVNPMSIGSEPAPPLAASELERFSAWAGRVLPLLARPGTLDGTATAALRSASPVRFDG